MKANGSIYFKQKKLELQAETHLFNEDVPNKIQYIFFGIF